VSGSNLAAAREGVASTLFIAGAIFALAYDGGGYSSLDRGLLAIAVWWAVLIVVGLGLARPASVARPGLAAGVLLGALAGWTLASVVWASNAEAAFEEFNRVALYLGVFVLSALASLRVGPRRWIDGVGIGIALTAFVALASRLFPHLFSARELPRFLPSSGTRLSFPVGYWNGLAILVGLGVPLLLFAATAARNPFAAALWLAPLPGLAAVIYLTSSRGGAATALVAVVALFALGRHGLNLVGALLIATAGSALAVGVLATRSQLVDGPLGSAAATSQGRSAAVLIALICLGSGFAYAACRSVLPPLRASKAVGRVVALAGLAALIGAVVAAHPVSRLHAFTRSPEQVDFTQHDFVQTHLLSGNSSGRWQFWTVAADAWKAAPLIGQGAGSFETWWARHASFTYFVKDAHSLYLGVLAELGLVGLALLVGALASGFALLARGLRSDERLEVATVGAVFVAFAFAAGIDWTWKLTIVPVLAFGCLGSTAASLAASRAAARRVRPASLALVVVSALVVCSQGLFTLAGIKLHESGVAVGKGRTRDALQGALAARSLEPWASSPYLQIALIEEQTGRLAAADVWARKAIARNRDDWRPWLVAARVETKLARVGEARRSLRQAETLNPLSPLFSR
jgi:hypothetical protein